MAQTQSIFKLAEQCRVFLPSVDIQVLIASVIDAYAVMAKREWFENKADGMSEVDGVFLYTFKDIVPAEDCDRCLWYIDVPSSYLRLPHEMGINWVSYMKDKMDFVRISNLGLWSNLKAFVLGGRQPYFIEGTRMYFPKMDSSNNGNILLRMAISLDKVDVREELNIPPNVASSIVDYVVAKFVPQKAK